MSCHIPSRLADFFDKKLPAFQMQNSSSYQVATTSLNIEQQTLLMEVMRIADQQAERAIQA